MTTTSNRPKTSIVVSPRFSVTDSWIPRKLISEITTMNTSPTRICGSSTNCDR